MQDISDSIDKAGFFVNALLWGAVIGAICAFLFIIFSKNKPLVENKYIFLTVLAAIVIALLPQIFAHHSDDVRVFGEFGQEITRNVPDTLTPQVLGKICGVLVGFAIEWWVHKKYF